MTTPGGPWTPEAQIDPSRVPVERQYALKSLRPPSRYVLTFTESVPPDVQAEVRLAAGEVTRWSGIEFVDGWASSDEVPRSGELRVGVGVQCGVANESGCTTTWASGGQVHAVDLTIAPVALDAWWRIDTILHELGHAAGLAHVDTAGYPPQVLDQDGNTLFQRYQFGDRAGLAASGARVYDATSSRVSAGLADVSPTPITHHDPTGH